MPAAEPRPRALRSAGARAFAALARGAAILLLVLGTAAALSFPLWWIATRRPALLTRGLGLLALALVATATWQRIRRLRGAARNAPPPREDS